MKKTPSAQGAKAVAPNGAKHSVKPAAYKLPQAAAYCSLSPLTLRRCHERGLLRVNKSTRHWLILVSELDRFLKDGLT
jgi:hypothetical protein